MTSKLLWARIALFSNFLGALLIFFAFQGTSSDFRLITAKGIDVKGDVSLGGTSYSICVNRGTLAATDDTGSLIMGMRSCPNWDKGKPAAVVVAEYPLLAFVGLLMTAFGFLVQFLLTFKLPELLDGPDELSGINRSQRRREDRERRR